jgi:hypothetical protein
VEKYALTEKFYFLGYNAVQTAESQPTFQKNKSPISSWLELAKQETSIKQTESNAGNPEYGEDIFLRNVRSLSTDYTALHPRKQNTS